MRWGGGDRKGILWQQTAVLPSLCTRSVPDTPWPSPHLKSLRYSKMEAVSGLNLHAACQLRVLPKRGLLHTG